MQRRDLLEAALIGYGQQIATIQSRMSEIRSELSGTVEATNLKRTSARDTGQEAQNVTRWPQGHCSRVSRSLGSFPRGKGTSRMNAEWLAISIAVSLMLGTLLLLIIFATRVGEKRPSTFALLIIAGMFRWAKFWWALAVAAETAYERFRQADAELTSQLEAR